MTTALNIAEETSVSATTANAISRLLRDLSSTPHPFTEDDLRNLVEAANTHLYTATDSEGKIVGMYTLGAYRIPTGIRVWLEDVVVAHEAQGMGLGRKLVEHAIDEARRLYPGATFMLTSRPSRLAANHIYSQIMQTKETNVYTLKL